MSSTKGPAGRVQKSFTGCARCKAKKKKCDESTPSCLACVRAGEECPGFVQSLRWSRKHERFQPQSKCKDGAEKRMNVTSRQMAEANSRNHDATPVPTPTVQHDDMEESPSIDSVPPILHNDLDVMFSQWLNAEFLPRNDLPLLGLNPPLGQPSNRFLNESLIWPTMDDSQTLQTMWNPYQDLEPYEQSYDCTPDYASTENTEEDYSHPGPQYRRPQGGKTYLETFYRMSTPTPYARFSSDHLIQHYFTDVCSLISCFDSPLNPFRRLVANEVKHSKTVSLAVQSMAIVHLANNYLYMAPLGIAKRCEAWKSLQVDLQRHRTGQIPLETVLISLLLLGTSAPWHQPSNLGLPYLYIMRTLMQGYFRGSWSARAQPRMKDEKFFADSLMHWEMLASFLDPFPMQSFPGYGMPDLQTHDQGSVLPHPWTGASTQLDLALAEVGRILRRRQRLSKASTSSRSAQSLDTHEVRWVERLEEFLRSIDPPHPDKIVEYGDRETPKSDLVCLSHAQQYAGLLELYRAYPHLYDGVRANRIQLPQLSNQPMAENLDHSGYTNSLNASLCTIAISVLDALRDMSISSSACRLLPLVLVSCSGHLRFPDQPLPGEEAQYDRHDQVIEARYFVESRMLALSTRYPQRQMLQILEIAKEVWDRLDGDRADNAHWMDVMLEKQMQTMMG